MAFDCFVKIGSIEGECTDEKHKGWIEVLSYSHGVSQPSSGSQSSGGARSAERCDHQDFSIVKTLDKTSPILNRCCCNGKSMIEVKVELCRATGNKEKYMEYVMTDVLISSVRPGGTSQGGETLPLEEVSFNYGKITWNYITTNHRTGKPGGNVETHWDLIENKGA